MDVFASAYGTAYGTVFGTAPVPAGAFQRPVLTIFLADSGAGWFHPRKWNPNIFPNLDQSADLATQQAQWLSDLTAFCTGTLFPHAAAVNATVILFWDGFCGQEFPGYAGDPSYYPPEVPQSSKRAIAALCDAAGYKAGECIRPTARNPLTGEQLYDADPAALYRSKVAASIADGFSAWWFDSSLKGTLGQTPLEANQYFSEAEVRSFADPNPDCEFYFEWYDHANYTGIPNVWAYHDPAGTPGTVGYNPDAGYLPSDVADDPAWDAHGIYYCDERVDPNNPTQAAALAASYARGARIFLYGGANYDLTGGGFFSDDQREDLYALWLGNYPFAPSGTVYEEITGGSYYSDGSGDVEDDAALVFAGDVGGASDEIVGGGSFYSSGGSVVDRSSDLVYVRDV